MENQNIFTDDWRYWWRQRGMHIKLGAVMNVIKKIDLMNEWVGRIFSWCIIFLTLLAVIEIIERRVFNDPTIWGFEVETQMFGLYFMILGGYGLLYGSHVSIDVFTHFLSKRGLAILDLFSYAIFFFPFTLVCIWQGYLFAAKSWSIMETSMSVFGPPLYPIKTVIVISFILMLLQGIAEVVKKIVFLKGGKTL
jgi:TRAP-type mannitol/chloroaromatic compound transport system permease small subunit